MLQQSSTLTTSVMSVAWQGPDAEELRQWWLAVGQRIRTAAQDLSGRAAQITEHAEEQDTASATDGDSAASVWERLGLPDLSTLFGDLASRASEGIGWAVRLADAVVPGGFGTGMGSPLLAALGKQMVLGNGTPTVDTPGVTDAYSDRYVTAMDSVGARAESDSDAGGASYGYSTSDPQIVDPQRTYDDGTWIRETRVGVYGDGGSDAEGQPYGIRYSSSEGPAEYELRIPRNENAAPTSFHEMYGVPYSFDEPQTISVTLTEAEMKQIVENNPQYGSTDFEESDADLQALAKYAAEGSNAGPAITAEANGVGPTDLPLMPGVQPVGDAKIDEPMVHVPDPVQIPEATAPENGDGGAETGDPALAPTITVETAG